MAKRKDEDIDYTAEGENVPHPKHDSTDKGYDEAVRSGGEYGVPEGRGGVFGTTGGGTYAGGMHVEERPVVDDGGTEDSGAPAGARGIPDRTPGTGTGERDKA